MAKIIDIALATLVGLALIAAGIFGLVLLINYLDRDSQAEVTAADDSWQRVQSAGKMVVGTAAEYPPFGYFVGPESIDGFDIALMDAIGQRLGVQVEYLNYPFDQLGDRLEQGEIDAAIAAISISPEGNDKMDFSQAYYVTQDAVLAYFTTPVTIRYLADLAGYRVGVQQGTIYESWLRRDLVGAALLAEENLKAYPEIDGAVAALTRGEIDFVVLDLPPAQMLAEQIGLRIAGQDLSRQSFAVAVPKGARSLQAEIDRAISQLRGDGTLAQLAWGYLASDLVPPTATATPGPPPPSTDVLPAPQTTTPRPGGSATPTFTATSAVTATATLTATGTPTATPGADNPLAGTSWLVTAYYNPSNLGGMASVLGGTSLTAAFASSGQVSGSAGCNSYSGSYVVDGSLLAITPMASTMLACDTPAGIMEQETAFLAALASASSFAIDGGQLSILNSSGQLVVLLSGQ